MKKLNSFLSLIFCVLVSSCNKLQTDKIHEIPIAEKGHRDTYFPEDSKLHYYKDDLIFQEEPSLYMLSNEENIEVYRLMIFPSFYGPTSIRIIRNTDGSGSLDFKRYEGFEGYSENILEHKSITITKSEMNKFLRILKRYHFWTMDHYIFTNVCDGATWVLEGTSDGNYRILVRNNEQTFFFRIITSYMESLVDKSR